MEKDWVYNEFVRLADGRDRNMEGYSPVIVNGKIQGAKIPKGSSIGLPVYSSAERLSEVVHDLLDKYEDTYENFKNTMWGREC